jgi:translocation and assembly module TamB
LTLAGNRLAALDLKVTFDRFRVLRRDEARATASGEIAIGGPLQKMTLSGDVKLDRLEIQIPDRLPASAPKIEVEEINRQVADLPPIEPAADRRAKEPGEEPALDTALDLAVRMPEVYIRGRGLDSEWRGKIKVAGTTKDPDITGRLELQRGTYALVGKPMQLTRGLVIFPGGPKINPDLDIVAERQTRDALARVELKGDLQSPKLDLSSTPPLPPDEVLSRVMFDKGTGQIGPGEAVQLAQAAAVLSGRGGPDLLGKLRNRFKLDQLGISTTTATGAEGQPTESPAVIIGKRITETVHVGVEQGAAPGSSSINVEVDITPNISVESDVGSAGRSGVGVRWKRDY